MSITTMHVDTTKSSADLITELNDLLVDKAFPGLKIGTKLRITKNDTAHAFEVGTEVTLTALRSDMSAYSRKAAPYIGRVTGKGAGGGESTDRVGVNEVELVKRNYKAGDRLKIVNNESYHPFPDGSSVTVVDAVQTMSLWGDEDREIVRVTGVGEAGTVKTVSLWCDEVEPFPLVLKVGDRVKIVTDGVGGSYHFLKVGTVATVVSGTEELNAEGFSGSKTVAFVEGEQRTSDVAMRIKQYVQADEIEVEAHSYKVGDVVKVTGDSKRDHMVKLDTKAIITELDGAFTAGYVNRWAGTHDFDVLVKGIRSYRPGGTTSQFLRAVDIEPAQFEVGDRLKIVGGSDTYHSFDVGTLCTVTRVEGWGENYLRVESDVPQRRKSGYGTFSIQTVKGEHVAFTDAEKAETVPDSDMIGAFIGSDDALDDLPIGTVVELLGTANPLRRKEYMGWTQFGTSIAYNSQTRAAVRDTGAVVRYL